MQIRTITEQDYQALIAACRLSLLSFEEVEKYLTDKTGQVKSPLVQITMTKNAMRFILSKHEEVG